MVFIHWGHTATSGSQQSHGALHSGRAACSHSGIGVYVVLDQLDTKHVPEMD